LLVNKTRQFSIIFTILTIIGTLLNGCGGGGGGSTSSDGGTTYNSVGNLGTGDEYKSSSTGTASYYLNVSDDVIIGARLKATKILPDKYGFNKETEVCESFTDMGAGLYSLNNCSVKPTMVTAIGGFIDIDGNGQFDTNEPTQNAPLIVDTGVLTDTNFTITPINTLAASNYSIDRVTLATKLGFSSRLDAYRANAGNQAMNRMVNGVLSAAVSNGFDLRAFASNLALRIVAADGAGVDTLKSAIVSLVNDPQSTIDYGDAQIKSFWNDARTQAVINGTDVMSAMLAKKIPSGKIRISGFVTTYLTGSNIISGAAVSIYVGTTKIGSGVSDRSGKYSIEVSESAVPNDSTLLLSAQTSTLKLTSSVPTNVLLSKRVNGNINTSNIGSLAVSHVTTFLTDNNNSVQSGATVKKLLFDSSSYTGKNKSNSTFFIPLTILYENQLFFNIANPAAMTPADIDTEYLTQIAKAIPVTSAPVVLDIEVWPLPYTISTENDAILKNTVDMYLLVYNTMKAARPELKFGFFGMIPNIGMIGTGSITQTTNDLVEHFYAQTAAVPNAEDFCAPGLYSRWNESLSSIYYRNYGVLLDLARRSNKPVINYLWPEYMFSMPEAGTYVSDSYWTNQVAFARDKGDSVAIWGGPIYTSSGVQTGIRPWDDTISWWQILKAAMN
jgi:hypothetical protein